ncbi:hypothetical protein WISP_104823 [Willisornis vidua]|uniref:Uncharacterized protein n=1 Tax=Willisornis vidua TaxID=1566151 RepID=A0ABQ9CXC5_9PASS|nr:hypothetical protein WISP_104823 [Willisornis vidua]
MREFNLEGGDEFPTSKFQQGTKLGKDLRYTSSEIDKRLSPFNEMVSGITRVLHWLKGSEKQIDTVEIQSRQMHMAAREVMNPVLQG